MGIIAAIEGVFSTVKVPLTIVEKMAESIGTGMEIINDNISEYADELKKERARAKETEQRKKDIALAKEMAKFIKEVDKLPPELKESLLSKWATEKSSKLAQKENSDGNDGSGAV